MTSVFLVEAESGSCGETLRWYVASYPTREEAERHAGLAQARNEEDCAWYTKEYRRYQAARIYRTIEDLMLERGLSPYDRHPYDGRTCYTVTEVSFVRHVDEYQEQHSDS